MVRQANKYANEMPNAPCKTETSLNDVLVVLLKQCFDFGLKTIQYFLTIDSNDYFIFIVIAYSVSFVNLIPFSKYKFLRKYTG